MTNLTSFFQSVLPIKRPVESTSSKSHGTGTPYLDARREWNERYGDYIAGKANWQRIAFVSIFANLVLIGGITYIATSSRVEPYVVEVEKGRVSAPIPLDKAARADQRIIRAFLSEYVQSARTVTTDPMVQKRWLDKIYASSSQQVGNYLNEYYRNNDPFLKSKSALVSVDVSTVLPLSEESWQVEWDESSRGTDGLVTGKTRWRALIGTQIIAPKTVDEMMVNPAGIIIKTLSWTQQL